jgi:prophage regulatory protein
VSKQHFLMAAAAAVANPNAGTPAQKPKAERPQSDIPEESVSSKKQRQKRALCATPWEGASGWVAAPHGPPEIWRLARVIRFTGLSRSGIYSLLTSGRFPRPITLSQDGRAVGWVSLEIIAYVRSRIAARDTEAVA